MSVVALAVAPQTSPFMLVDNLVSIYDNNGKSERRFTAVISHDASHEFSNKCVYYSFDANPLFTIGLDLSGKSEDFINKPNDKHLGKRILFDDLPAAAKQALWAWVVNVYYPFGED